MKNWKYLLFGLAFLLLAFFVISETEPSPPLLSITQTSGGNHTFLYEGIVKGVLAVQEIHTEKEYINGLSIRFATMGRVNTNTNTILVIDSNYNLLYQEKFSSSDVEDTKYHSFQFGESRKTGRGNKLYICLFSIDGDSANCLHVIFNPGTKKGRLYASLIRNDDVIRSIANRARLYPGAMMLRTYESGFSITSMIRISLYIIALLIAALIIFFKSFQNFLLRITIRPEILYVIIALIFGSLFVFTNPPFQAPDEGAHLTRSYELSKFEFSGKGKTIPQSVIELDSSFTHLHFNPDEKTSRKEIMDLLDDKLNPGIRAESDGPHYTVPFLPQLIGLFVGKVFNPSPLAAMYFGRIFNLIVCIIFIFLAIRITPFAKWLFFMLALMPKTLYLMSSLSYDAFLICDSFLLIALLMHDAFKAEKLGWRDLGLLFFLSVLLAMCKPPYFFIGFLFLIIPVRKIGTIKKYAAIFAILVVSMFWAQGAFSLVREMTGSAGSSKTEKVDEQEQKTKNTEKEPSKNSSDPGAGSMRNEVPRQQETKEVERSNEPKPEASQQTKTNQVISPPEQINFIRSNPLLFLKLLFLTNVDYMRANILNNFVGVMGWLDAFLPDIFINIYLFMLLAGSLLISDPLFSIDWKRKSLFFIIFLSGVLLIEVAMYIFVTYVGIDRLYGVQGRYLIPFAPLFFLVFYNNFLSEKLNFLLSPRRQSFKKAKPGQKTKIMAEIKEEQMFTRYMKVMITLVVVVTLARSVATILLRYYQW